jgi:glycosyltransferase involved in cell wall biosynthesis
MVEQLQASVIIPTYNRARCLFLCLKALAVQTVDNTAFEIVVVDNNSRDDTQDTVLKFAQSHPGLRIRYVCEKKQGASHARNRGVAEACGEVLCFLDDDAPPSPGWLGALLEGVADPTVGCVGGPAMLDYRGQERPPWLLGELQGLLSGYKLPYTEPTSLSSVEEFPFGCNMAFRRGVFADLGPFRTDLDRVGGEVLAAGDTDMIGRVKKAGWKVLYLPNAIVRHLVAPERLKKSHIYRIGRGLAASHVILTSDPRPYMVVRWFASDLRYAIHMFLKLVVAIVRQKPLWFDDYMRFWVVAQRIPMRARMLLKRGTCGGLT